MFYQLVDVQIQQIAEEGFHARGRQLETILKDLNRPYNVDQLSQWEG